MANYKHQSAARVVGWIDLVMKILQFCALVYMFIESAKIMKEKNVGEDTELHKVLKDVPKDDWSTLEGILKVTLGIVAVITVIQFLAAIALILASQEDRAPQNALRLVKFWRISTSVFLVFGIMGGVSLLKDGRYMELIAQLIPIVFLILVQPFRKELIAAQSEGREDAVNYNDLVDQQQKL